MWFASSYQLFKDIKVFHSSIIHYNIISVSSMKCSSNSQKPLKLLLAKRTLTCIISFAQVMILFMLLITQQQHKTCCKGISLLLIPMFGKIQLYFGYPGLTMGLTNLHYLIIICVVIYFKCIYVHLISVSILFYIIMMIIMVVVLIGIILHCCCRQICFRKV